MASFALCKIAQHVDVRVKVVWTREEDIQHDTYLPYWFDRMSAGPDETGMPIAWKHRFAGSSIIARWLPPAFQNGLDIDSIDGAIDLVYALPNMRVVWVEPPGVPTAFWRSVGPSHDVLVVESFMDELAAAAKQDPVPYRRSLLDKSPRAKAVFSNGRNRPRDAPPASRVPLSSVNARTGTLPILMTTWALSGMCNSMENSSCSGRSAPPRVRGGRDRNAADSAPARADEATGAQ